MDNRIRYAWGEWREGKFLVAMAGSELVTFGFPAHDESAVGYLRRRFSDAAIEEDASGLANTVAELTHFLGYFNSTAKKG
jgi:hypothetical protein